MATIAEALAIGWRSHQAGNLAEAEHCYRQVIAAAPHNADAWCYLGMLLHDQRRWSEAEQAYLAPEDSVRKNE